MKEEQAITEAISTKYTMETLKGASEEVELYEGNTVEMPTEEYVEWLERKVYELLIKAPCEECGKFRNEPNNYCPICGYNLRR